MIAPILTVTLNPALDVVTSVPRLIPQQKLRCEPPRYLPGGGGINVSRAIRELGGDSHAFVALGGGMGAHYRRLLDDSGISSEIWPIAEETRFSLNVLERETGLHYRYVLPGPDLAADESDRLLVKLSRMMATGYPYVVASGSLPAGVPVDFYGRLADLARGQDSLLVLDAQGAALRAALPFRPHIIRLADYEAQQLVGGPPGQAAAALADALIARAAAEIVIVTVGGDGAIVRTLDRRFEVRPPLVTVHSAVGAGDSFVAALTLALSRGWAIEDAVRYGVAAAASAVTTSTSELCERGAVERYFTEIGGTAPKTTAEPAV